MYVERASVFIKEILDSQINSYANGQTEKPLTNWELDFIATICRIGMSGKIVELTDAQTNSLMAIYFRHILHAKCRTVINNSEYKCEACVDGIVEDNVGPVRCKICEGHGYTKEAKKPKEFKCLNCNNGQITEKDGDHTCPKCDGTGFVKAKPRA